MTDLKFLIVDVETDGLDPSVIWCAVTKDYQTGGVREFLQDDADTFNTYTSGFVVVAHNGLGFDVPVLNKLWGSAIASDRVLDTLVLSRLRNSWDYSDHSLGAWGERLKFRKGNFSDFSCYTPEMLAYCKQDVEVTYKLLKRFESWWKNPDFHKSIALEHHSALMCEEISNNGFSFDKAKALEMYDRLTVRLQELDDLLQQDFPPEKFEEVFIPKVNNVVRGYEKGVPFIKVKEKVFNPRSTKDRVEALWKLGWKPTEKTDGHIKAIRTGDKEKLEKYKTYGWKTSEENLATLPPSAPESTKRLVEHMVLSSRHSTLNEWLGQYNEETGRIHGRFNHIGPWTHRKSHSAPNMANIPAVARKPKDREPTPVESINLEYNGPMRSLWYSPGLLVGVDADSIQLRVLAHYLGDEGYAKAVTEGRQEDQTDVHNVNRRALRLPHLTRDHAKTFIYAWLLGAATPKVASILTTSLSKAKKATDSFVESTPGLKELKKDKVPYDAARGYFTGFDGRPIRCDSEHKMLAGYLQAGESVIMKWANRIWYRELKASGVWFKQVNDVHDEWQTEVRDNLEEAEFVKQTQINSIRLAGEQLGIKCQLDGSGSIGKNWKDTH